MQALLRIAVTFALLTTSVYSMGATHRALIVGVTKYPAWMNADLIGPANDAALTKKVLALHGFSENQIVELSESPTASAQPTRDNILKQLEALAAKSQKGDFVYLHFGGHGSRQPVAKGDDTEADDQDEIFLPSDVAKWDEATGLVENAITDNEVGEAVDRIRDRGANVWLVFDSCHSGTMMRGGSFSEVRYRKLNPDILGIPKTSGIKTRGTGSEPPGDGAGLIDAKDEKPGEGRGYLMAFSAAQSTQTTPEMSLPLSGDNRQNHGLFTYSMMEVLAANRGISYNQLGQKILEKYRLAHWRNSQPLISGTDLNAPIFEEDANTTAIWPASEDSQTATIEVSAGSLQGFTEKTVINLYSDPLADKESFLGRATVRSSSATTSEAVWLDSAPESSAEKYYAVIIEPAAGFTLSVNSLPINSSSEAEKQALQKSIADIVQNNPLLRAWDGKETADLRVSIFENRAYILLPDESLPCEHQKLSQESRKLCLEERPKQNLLFVTMPELPNDYQTAINSGLTRIARGENIIQMQSRLDSGIGPVKISLKILREGGSLEDYPIAEVPVFGKGDKVTIHIENTSSKPQDVSILYKDARYGIAQLWPRNGQSSRLQEGESRPITIDLYPEPEGLEDLIILSQPGSNLARDFAFLSQQPLGVALRGSKSGAFEFREQENVNGLQLLMDSAVYANPQSQNQLQLKTRGARVAEVPEMGGMQVYRWEVKQ